MLQKSVSLPFKNTEQPSSKYECKRSFLDDLFEDDGLDGYGDDEVARFIQECASVDEDTDLLYWWKRKVVLFLNIPVSARNALPVQAFSASSESFFSHAGNLINEDKGFLADDNISACICLQAWQKLLQS